MIKINVQNFPDGNFRNWLLNQNYAKDGVLTEKILSEITKMDIRKCSIHSLKGIEHFTALTKLICCWNELTELDLSHNTVLTELDCSFNQLTSLNVSHNHALRKLKCSNINSQAVSLWTKSGYTYSMTLDLSHNAALTELDCSANLLTSLDLSHNTALKVLDCSTNLLTSLDLSHTPTLKILDCSCNELTKLDLSHNPTLVKVNCCWNALTSLDLSHNTALAILDCFECNQGCKAAMDTLIASLPQTDGGAIFAGDDYSIEEMMIANAKGWEIHEGPQITQTLKRK